MQYKSSILRFATYKNGTDATVKSNTAPTDTTKMWLDTSVVPNILKYFNGNAWVMANDQTNDIDQAVNEMKQTIYDEHISSLIVATDNITSSVKHITETVEGHTSTLEQVSTTVELNATGITEVRKDVVTVKDDLSKKATKEEIARWANLNGDVLTLGRSDSDFKTQLDSTKLSFLQGQNEIAAAANNEFYGDTMRANKEWKLSELRFRKTKKCYVMQ